MARAKSSPATSSSSRTAWVHQTQTLTFYSKQKCTLDLSDAGTGKTFSCVVEYARRLKPRGRLLVICPKTLMKSAWAAEFDEVAPEVSYSLAYAEQRKEAFDLKTDVVIMNTDGVKWLFENKHYLKAFDHLVIDEITSYKHPNSQRSKAMLKISKAFVYRRGLTATPTPNTVMELWHPMKIIDGGARLGTSYFDTRSILQNPVQVGPGRDHINWVDKPGAADAVHHKLRDVIIRHEFEDVMKHVPPNHRDRKLFDLAPRARKAYDTMLRDCIMAHKDALITAVHAASLRTKLLQIASGAVYASTDDESGYTVIDPTRYELIAELIEERKHSVVFFNWRHQRDQLMKILKGAGVEFAMIDGSVAQKHRDEIVTDYQKGQYQTVLMHPRTGAHGLTLTRGDTTILSSPIYEADLLKQGIHRIYRGTQDKITNTIMIQARNTVEDLVYERLDGKYANMSELLGLMKQRL
jgi:SNF2 family DNA or RNA helicase